MIIDENKKFLIIGLGLLGGSYAKALSAKGYTVRAIDTNENSIKYALSNGFISEGDTAVNKDFIDNSDIVVFALYPHIFVDWVEENGHLFKAGTIVTDVTGVKGIIVKKIQSLMPEGVEFISAHPMAGKEVSGVENADDSIFKVANYIVVPTERNTFNAINICKDLGETLGFKEVSWLSVEDHDRMIAYLSQLTHCIAVSLMCANETPGFERYTGDSFRDLTRIAKINDEMWSELFLSNREALLSEMDRYRESFDKLYNFIKTENRDGMREMMRLSTHRRKHFDKKV